MMVSTFTITHASSKTVELPSVFINSHVRNDDSHPSYSPPSAATRKSIRELQAQLPFAGQTPLISLPGLATKYKQAHVFVKDESNRFGLPSFKILGASWAIYRALCQRLDLQVGCSLDKVKKAVRDAADTGSPVRLISCSAGNWGRAVARMSAVTGVEATVYLPRGTEAATRDLIASEGVNVIMADQDYDELVQMMWEKSKKEDLLLAMDTSWEGYEEFPRWVTEGYSAMLDEVAEQVISACGKDITAVIASVGVGSWAQAVVERYKGESSSKGVKITTVEPEKAACLVASLEAGQVTSIRTSKTIMNGMNCGTVSRIAWPSLKAGVDVAVAVNDQEVHEMVEQLQGLDLTIGPCGAADFVALDKLYAAGQLEDNDAGVVVVFSTEGPRDYQRPG
ncbi:tryptophan synthase beta subunit-like PLP-dependent enzyme [Elsinoe ampelina]|uniref:Tryptophan synthase beta subunit-like PLP-dependent enzyme n=1 Tax=Elsinoe ampelina TaxID=302913 RepID=A0A6A6FYP0_9PEZI|nr:tryptophan synthase beta subunit-like PLP-dependent enzyme [Elsinoe ampelina]